MTTTGQSPERAALVEKIAAALAPWCIENRDPNGPDASNRIYEWPDDEIEYARHGGWKSFEDRSVKLQEIRRRKVAEAVLALLESGTAGIRVEYAIQVLEGDGTWMWCLTDQDHMRTPAAVLDTLERARANQPGETYRAAIRTIQPWLPLSDGHLAAMAGHDAEGNLRG